MKGFKSKKGISLIVLVITIIVMIILAAAIILSLNNSGIIDKANKAKQDSDAANLKEYVNVLAAEWELMTESEKNASEYASKEAYVNGNLTKKGYSAAYSAEGEIYTVANDVAKDALSKGIKIGEVVKYTIADADKQKATPEYSKTGGSNAELETQTNLTWIYIGVSKKGELLITPDVSNGILSNSNVDLRGKQGWVTGPEELNTVCDKLYTVSGKGTARSMNIDDVTTLLGYTGEKGSYTWVRRGPEGGLIYETKLTPEPMKIGDIEEKLGITLTYRETPESKKKLEDYYSNRYGIGVTSSEDLKKLEHPEYIDLVIPKSGNYWLASNSAYFYQGVRDVVFYVNTVSDYACGGLAVFFSDGEDAYYGTSGLDVPPSLRPVVSITSNIQKSTESGKVVWEFPS